MRWVSATLAMVLATVTVIWLVFLWKLWAARNTFEIRARSPAMMMVVMVQMLVLTASVLLHWLLLSIGKTLPCYVIFAVSYGVAAFAAAPYFIRAVLLVVAYNREYRAKYARFLKSKLLMRGWAIACAAIAVRAILFFGEDPVHASRDVRQCFYFDDILVLTGVLVVGGGPITLLASRLASVQDAFKIREEITHTTGGCFLFGAITWLLQVLVIFGLLAETPQVHLVLEVMTLFIGVTTGFCGLFLPLLRVHRGGLARWFIFSVAPVEDDADVRVADIGSLLTMARGGGELGELFGSFCRANLCMESWDFIFSAMNYEATRSPNEQFEAFTRIIDQYFLPTSPDEVNICSGMRKHLLCFRTREPFMELSDEARRNILEEPLAEIARLLEHNLLDKFKQMRERQIRETERILSEAAEGDREIMRLMRTASGRAY